MSRKNVFAIEIALMAISASIFGWIGVAMSVMLILATYAYYCHKDGDHAAMMVASVILAFLISGTSYKYKMKIVESRQHSPVVSEERMTKSSKRMEELQKIQNNYEKGS